MSVIDACSFYQPKGVVNMFQKTITILGLSALILISGCASDPTWKKAGVSHNDAVSAHADCKYQVGLNKVAKSEQNELIQNCMQAKGFRWRAN